MPRQSRLIYVWTKDYKALQNNGFCLVADYKITFDGEKFTFAYNKDIPVAFNELKNICTLVGKNGVGKSSALELIDEVISVNQSTKYLSIFEITGEDGVKTIEIVPLLNYDLTEISDNTPYPEPYQSLNEQITEVNISSGCSFQFRINSNGSEHGGLYNTISDSEFKLDEQSYNGRYIGLIVYNSSDSDEVHNSMKNRGSRERCVISTNLLQHVKSDKSATTLKNLSDLKTIFKDIIDLCDEEVKISYFSVNDDLEREVFTSFNKIYGKNIGDEPLKAAILSFKEVFHQKIESKIKPNTRNIFWSRDKSNIFKFTINFLVNNKSNTIERELFSRQFSNEFNLNPTNISEFNEINTNLNEITASLFTLITSLIKFFNEAKSRLITIPNTNNLNGSRNKIELQFSAVETDANISVYNFKEILKDLINKNPQFEVEINTVLKPYWLGISSGELNVLKLFSGMMDCDFSPRVQFSNNIILLLDEPEQAYHPEWQRKFIQLLITFTKYMKEMKYWSCDNIQIVMTTHSPFTISDLLEENTHYLDSDNKNKTLIIKNKNAFAGNIHELLINKFFLSSTIGSYSEKTLKKTICFMNNSESQKKDRMQWASHKLIIERVSDPLLKRELLKIYNEKLPPTHVDREKDYLNILKKFDKNNLSVSLSENDLSELATLLGKASV